MAMFFYCSFLFAFALDCSAEFVDIDAYHKHVFPDDIRDLNIPTTLLHYHSHVQAYLVYSSTNSESYYVSNLDGFYPCSWYLGNNGSMIAYEYSEEKHEYNEDNIMDWLLQINDTGYGYYGTTVRKIDNVNEIVSDVGFMYKKYDKLPKVRTESAITNGGRAMDSDDDDDGTTSTCGDEQKCHFVSNIAGYEMTKDIRRRQLVAFEELVKGLTSIPVV